LTDRHFESVVFNVGDLGDLGGDFSFQVGDFCSLTILKFWIDWKKLYLLLWNQSNWCTFDSKVRDTGLCTKLRGEIPFCQL